MRNVLMTVWLLCALPAQASDPLSTPSLPSQHAEHLMSARIVLAGDRLVSVGERGTVLLSDDQGRSWRQAAVPVRVTLTSLCFATPRLGWAVGHGGVVLATKDAGETWDVQLDGRRAAEIESSEAKSALARAPDDEQVQSRMREAQGLVHDGPDKPFLDAHCFDETHVLIVGAYGLAFRTADGGASWQSAIGTMDNPRRRHLYGIVQTGNTLYIAGEQGLVLRSDDGSVTFHHLDIPAKGTFFGVVTGEPGTVVVFGLRGALYRSGDSGASWSRIAMPPAGLTAGKRLADGRLVLADEAGHLWLSRDDGKSFTEMRIPEGAALSGLEQASGNALVLSSMAGNLRIAFTETPK